MPALSIDLRFVAYACFLTLVMNLTASALKSRGKAGREFNMSARDGEPPPISALAARADRAVRNMLENLPLFIGLVAVAHLSGRGPTDRTELGAHIFFWARVVYWPLYLAGVPVVRSVVFGISLVGLGLIFSAIVLP